MCPEAVFRYICASLALGTFDHGIAGWWEVLICRKSGVVPVLYVVTSCPKISTIALVRCVMSSPEIGSLSWLDATPLVLTHTTCLCV
jgi:hypothetical protein